jgi:hypothetical protein
MKKPTIASLQSQIAALLPYQELCFALTRGETPIEMSAKLLDQGENEVHVELYALSRSCGGIVRVYVTGKDWTKADVEQERVISASTHYLDTWCMRVLAEGCSSVYLCDLVSKVRKAQKEAIEKRVA